MSDLAEQLREKSKRDDALIVGSEIRAALQEQRDRIEALEAVIDLIKTMTWHPKQVRDIKTREMMRVLKALKDNQENEG